MCIDYNENDNMDHMRIVNKENIIAYNQPTLYSKLNEFFQCLVLRFSLDFIYIH